jgi:hypothetical protein
LFGLVGTLLILLTMIPTPSGALLCEAHGGHDV